MTLLAGCASGTGADRRTQAPAPAITDTAPGPGAARPPGPITLAEAGRIVDTYERVNTAANRTFDVELLASVEGGGLFELDRAAYKQRAAMPDAELALYQHGYTYAEREFLIPGDSTWFAMAARSRDTAGRLSTDHVLVIFDRDWKDWKAVASCWMDPAVRLTPVRGADGRPQAVNDTENRRGVVAPDTLKDSVADLYVTGGQQAGAVLADNPVAAEMRRTPVLQQQALAPDGTARYQLGRTGTGGVYALETVDGGTLVVFDAAVSESDTGSRAQATVYPSPLMQPYVGTHGASTFRIDHLHQSCAYIPTQGRVRLLASRNRITAVQLPQPGDVR